MQDENKPRLKVAISQLSSVVGDLDANATRLLEQINQAKDCGADIFVTSELALTGYVIKDLIYRKQFHIDINTQLQRFFEIKDITILLGLPVQSGYVDYKLGEIMENGTPYYNSVLHIRDGQILGQYNKTMLAQYGVFDEMRHFKASDNKPYVFIQNGLKVGVIICEDVWRDSYTRQLQNLDLDLVYIANGSPYVTNKHNRRIQVTKNLATKLKCNLIYVNCVGYQDGIVFDGASFALDPEGQLSYQSEAFAESLDYISITKASLSNDNAIAVGPDISVNAIYEALSASDNLNITNPNIKAYPTKNISIYKALELAVTDYVRLNNFPGVVIGLSGGIDSALTLAICCDALGADKVMAVFMPSQYTSKESINYSREMANRLGVKYHEIDIEPLVDTFKLGLSDVFAGHSQDVTEENLQARVRGVLLMSISNKLGYLLVSTGNKSEMAMGYATLYGDMAGGLALLKDVLKTEVYELANWRNSLTEVIPSMIITRAPSAELRANQVDQDSLPEYAILDQIINHLVIDKLATTDIIAKGFKAAEVELTAKLLQRSEFKRQQSATGPKISPCCLGMDWRYPITSKYNY